MQGDGDIGVSWTGNKLARKILKAAGLPEDAVAVKVHIRVGRLPVVTASYRVRNPEALNNIVKDNGE